MSAPYLTIRVPRKYMQELQLQNKSKYHAFMEWITTNEELEFGILDEMHSLDFFAKSWGHWEYNKCIKPKSTKTVRNWLKEFEEEMEKFDSGWALRRWQRSARVRNNSVEKQSTPKVHSKYSEKGTLNPTKSDFEKMEYTQSTPKVHQDNNIYDDDNADFLIEKEFDDLFFTYRALNAKYAGKKMEALEAYRAWRKIHSDISVEDLKKAIRLYMADSEIKKKNGFKSFIMNELYFEYMPCKIKFNLNGVWVDSVWKPDEILYRLKDMSPIGTLNKERFKQHIVDGNILLEVA